MQPQGSGRSDPPFRGYQGWQGKPLSDPTGPFSSQESGNRRPAEAGARRNETISPFKNPFEHIPEFSDDESESNEQPPVSNPRAEVYLAKDPSNVGAGPATKNRPQISNFGQEPKVPPSTASNSERLGIPDRAAELKTSNQNYRHQEAEQARIERERQIQANRPGLPFTSTLAQNDITGNAKRSLQRPVNAEHAFESSTSNSMPVVARSHKMDVEHHSNPVQPSIRPQPTAIRLEAGAASRPGRIEPEAPARKAGKTGKRQSDTPKPRAMTQARKPRSSLAQSLQNDIPHIKVGENIPRAAFEKLLVDITKDFRAAQRGMYDRNAVGLLRAVTESFLVERFRRATFITRARGRMTLSPIDLATMSLLDEDERFSRRSNSAPQLVIGGV